MTSQEQLTLLYQFRPAIMEPEFHKIKSKFSLEESKILKNGTLIKSNSICDSINHSKGKRIQIEEFGAHFTSTKEQEFMISQGTANQF